MHHGIILLTKAETRTEGLSKVEKFMEWYKGSEWDWYEIGGRWTGKLKPYSDPKENVLPLKDCLRIVKAWQQTIEHAKAEERKAQEWLNIKDENGNLYNNWNRYGFGLFCAARLYRQEFSFEANIFNIETHDFSVPEDPAGFYAVMIDMHI